MNEQRARKGVASSLGSLLPSLALASAMFVGAQAVAGNVPAAEAPKSEPARRELSRRSNGRGLEARIRQLTNQLDLDAGQQAQLRSLLVSEHNQVKRVWANASMSGEDHVSATRAILDATGDRIRAMLTGEQRAKFGIAHQRRDAENSAHPDVEYWLRLTPPRAAKNVAPSN